MAKAKVRSEELASVFEERAEHLSPHELSEWTEYTPRDEALIRKLTGPGAKLLMGPRGSGKSTLLKTAYFRALDNDECLPIYVNYRESLALEPLLHRQANALQIFRQWVLLKIVDGIRKTFSELKSSPPEIVTSLIAESRRVLPQLEARHPNVELREFVSPGDLAERLEQCATALERTRCVLLLDDAAHAFSPEQQREFFEVFRTLRTRRISPKAAVYPGITSYSPNFHVGHEAELLEAWYQPEDPGFLSAMRSVVERRLPQELRSKLKDRAELIDLLALASFGIPRGFLNMMSQLFGVEERTSKGTPNRQKAEDAIRDHGHSVRAIFKSLALKLPRYKHFVEMGEVFEQNSLQTLGKYNKAKAALSDKTTTIALKEPIGAPLERVLNLLEYAGIIRSGRSVSRGVKGKFQRYTIHNAIVISENALALGRSFTVESVVEALMHTTSHAFARTSGSTLLGSDFESKCKLDLPSCASCGSPRTSDEQRFCTKCGAELVDASLYEELLRQPITQLGLTQKKLDGIAQYTEIRTIQDILLDDEMQKLRDVPSIGSVWAKRIRNLAEEFVGV